MKLVYICGPYRAATIHGTAENIRKAEGAAKQVWKAGLAALCPHLNTAFFDGLIPDDDFLAGTMEMLRCCDAIFLTTLDCGDSEGVHAELREAHKRNIPVFTRISDLLAYFHEQHERECENHRE